MLMSFLVKEAETILSVSGNWAYLVDLVSQSDIASKAAVEPILALITESLLTSGLKTIPSALNGFEQFAKASPKQIRSFLSTDQGKRLLPNILLLTESPDDNTAQSASNLNAILHSILGDVSNSGNVGHSMLEVLTSGLQEAGESSVSVETLVSEAQNLIREKRIPSLAHLLPPSPTWSDALEPFIGRQPPNQELSITHPLAGAVFLTEFDEHDIPNIPRDAEGYSIPLRMGLYCTRLFRSAPENHGELHSDLYRLLAITLQLANDNLSVAGSTNLWSVYNPETEAEMTEFVSECQKLLSTWLQNSNATFPDDGKTLNTNFIGDAAKQLFDDSDGLHLKSYYSAEVYAATIEQMIELHGWQSKNMVDLETELKRMLKLNSSFQLHAFLAAYQVPLSASTVASRTYNGIIADLDALDMEEKAHEGLRLLVSLNAFIQKQEPGDLTIAKQRLVRFVRKAVAWLNNDWVTDQLRAEICRALCVLLPVMSEMYGDHWSAILAYIVSFWNQVQSMPDEARPALLPAIHASLKLYNIIFRMKSKEENEQEDERNDDLVDAWEESQQDAAESLLKMLKLRRDFPDEMHQPLRIVNELLSRQAVSFPGKYIIGTEDLYPQVYSQSRSVQQAAFEILHVDIPRHQDEVALEAVLDKKAARLPDELLSLILEPPTMAGLENEDFERAMPLSLRGYLLSWILVFDHFEHAVSSISYYTWLRDQLAMRT
jgi:hypothetical protein